MGVAFDRWLSQPGTLHFLSRLVASTGNQHAAQTRITRSCRSLRQYRRYATQTGGSNEGQDNSQRRPFWIKRIYSGHQDVANAPELGLKMSLNSGVAILNKDGDPSKAFSDLHFQSDVNSTSKMGKLLVDQPLHKDNTQLWIEILHFRQRVHGYEGVLDVWRGMRRRFVDLPVEGPEADALWTSFIDASIASRDERKDQSLLIAVLNYARDLKARTGLQYPGLYKCIVGRHIRFRLADTASWHDLLIAAGLAGPQNLASVVVDATYATDHGRSPFRIWADLHQPTEDKNVYDTAIGEVLKLNDAKSALRWHRWLLKHGFPPSTEMFETAGVQELFERDGNRSLPMTRARQTREAIPKPGTAAVKAELPKLTRASMNTIVGDVHGIKAKEISDSFSARLFATRTFPLDLLIKGVSFLNIQTLGPLTLRELAVRAGSPQEMNARLDELNKLGIRVGNSVFAEVVSKAARSEDLRLWNAVLESDQHPDEFENATTQEALMASFLHQQKLDQVYLTLAALSMRSAPGAAQHRAWNFILQHYIVHRVHRSMLGTLRTMHRQGIPLTVYSLTLLRRYLLPERRRAKRPVISAKTTGFHELDLVRNACILTATKRHYVPIKHWVELLKRYGMTHQWAATERLVSWLFDHYTTAKVSLRETPRRRHLYLGRTRGQQTSALRLLFSPIMLQALVTWGFRSAGHELKPKFAGDGQPPCEPWARGLLLLYRIQQRKLFDVTSEARSAFQQRMWHLFGAGYSGLEINNKARRLNRLSLVHYINHANEIWQGLVDWVEPELLQQDGGNDPKLMTQFFGSFYRTKLKSSEYANVAQWATALSRTRNSHYFEPLNIWQKERAWKESYIRVFRQPLPLNLQKAGKRHHPDPHAAQESSSKEGTLAASYQPFAEHQAPTKTTEHTNSHPLPAHQSPSARSWSLRRPPSPRYIPAPP